MVILALHPGTMKSFHVISLLLGILVFVVLGVISFLMNYKKTLQIFCCFCRIKKTVATIA